MRDRIPGSRLEVFEGAGHGVFRDRASEALSVISAFVCAADDGPSAGA
jgi:pimeloyl-ACP methyl ester carboxylesterase